MATRDGRRRSEAEKAETKRARIARASGRRRVNAWSRAAYVAEMEGYPLNVALSITWSALSEAERHEGHCLGLPAVERERRLWAALRAVAARAGVPWLAARAPEHDRRRGLHLHVALHLPNSAAIRDAIDVIERLTGAPAERVDMGSWSYRGNGRTHRGIVAWSSCRGWIIQRRVQDIGDVGRGLAVYIAKGDGKAQVEGQHRLSNELAALARSVA